MKLIRRGLAACVAALFIFAVAALPQTSLFTIRQGGTGARTAAAALVNLLPAGTRVGDMLYCSAYSGGACTAWTLVAGNNSGTAYLQETSGGAPSWTSPGAITANNKIRDFGTTFGDTGGSALTLGSVVYFTVPYACTISAWNMALDAGTATIDIWKIATGTAVPTVSNTITASALPAIASGTALHSTTLTSWTTSVSANDIFGFQLKTVATAKFVSIDVECDQ